MSNAFNQHAFHEQIFKPWVDAQKSKKQAAALLEISESYLGDLYHKTRAMSAAVAERLGFRKQVMFVHDPLLELKD